MKNKILLFTLVALMALPLSAQNSLSGEKTILYLIPFYSKQYDSQLVSGVKDCNDLQKIGSFQLMGFWAGAQVALDEFNEQNVHLNVIVKDVTDNEAKLRSIMEDRELMSRVDLIVGPFFGPVFSVAAQYAKEYGIPIVNPFTTRTDILKDNEFVYKLVPSLETRAATIAFFSDMYPQSQIILYADSTKNKKEYNAYTRYFRTHNVPFVVLPLQNSLVSSLSSDKKNIVVMLTHESAKMMMVSRDLIYRSQPENIVLVVPEELLKVHTYDIEYYTKLNIHFFSDYYIDKKNERTQVFVHNYLDKFGVPPTLEAFSYQGYDITRYFVSALYNDMDLDRVKTETIGYHFIFDKIPEGGYENINSQFLEVTETGIQTVGY
ncbi:MAG: amino acid ABC transporter substrate-binding protein [Bacteroidales bacterium]|nr:amino acid ABC transporter substrate-binding protein [Bacteroidales bacterium]